MKSDGSEDEDRESGACASSEADENPEEPSDSECDRRQQVDEADQLRRDEVGEGEVEERRQEARRVLRSAHRALEG